MLAQDINVNVTDAEGNTVLIVAASSQTALVLLLLRQGAVVNVADQDGWNALMGAAAAGQVEVV